MRVLNPNGISIGAAVFAGLTSVTDRPTDHGTRLVTIGHFYVRGAAMQPNNHGLRGSASLVLTATGLVNGRWRFSTPYRIDTLNRSP